MTQIDVAIIGGGLAGTRAAIQLANSGYSVALYEAGSYPQHKVCGEFMSHGCRTLLKDVGVDADAVGAASIGKTIITAPNGACWQEDLPGSAMGISRFQLDTMLSAQAMLSGVDVRERTTVTDIQGDLHRGFTLHTRKRETFSAKVVIGAYGKRSTVDRSLKRDFLQTRQPFIGMKQHARGLHLPNAVELHIVPGGYCGMSRIEDGMTNICMLVREDTFRQHGQGSQERFVEWMTTQNPVLAERLSRAELLFDKWLSIAQVPFMSKGLVQNDVLMAGDSAGMITPLTGDGMEMALGQCSTTYQIAT
ncbi:MAG: NAD(P)/FAD-dependent oxidoreductase, partial [Chloroflexota bacterium]